MVDVMGLARKTRRYELADGLREFHHAFWILVTGLYAWIVWGLPGVWQPFAEFARDQGIAFVIVTLFILPIGVPLVVSQFGMKIANEHIRRRWLWRSSGYIKPKPWVIPRTTLFAAYAITLAVFVAAIVLAVETRDGTLILRGLYVGVGLGFAAMYMAAGVSLDLPRYRWIAFAGVGGTVILALLPLRVGLFPLTLSVFWAALLITSGTIALRRFAMQQDAISDAA